MNVFKMVGVNARGNVNTERTIFIQSKKDLNNAKNEKRDMGWVIKSFEVSSIDEMNSAKS